MHPARFLLITVLVSVTAIGSAASPPGKVLLQDNFEREESNPTAEQVGNGWGTNSQKRAQGHKQVDLVDGAMHITRAAVADHGVSVFHDVQFRDAVIQLRFKLGTGDDLGINIADLNEKSVHAGHICVARIRPNRVEITDLKTGNMNLQTRQARLAKKLTPAMQQMLQTKTAKFAADLAVDEWHSLTVRIKGNTMSVTIDGRQIGSFQSEGIGHPTKSRLRLAVNKSAWIDDVRIEG